MLLFDENDTSELSDDQQDQHDNTDHMQQPDTDIPGVRKWQVEPKSDLYGDRTEKVVIGRLTELKHIE